jgi:hypothetical protein
LNQAARLKEIRRIVKESGVASLLQEKMPKGGRPRRLSCHAVLVGIMLALSDHRPAHLVAAYRTLLSLGVTERIALGVSWHEKTGLRSITYRQFADTHQVMIRCIDPSPVPSFKKTAPTERAAHLQKVRSATDPDQARAALEAVSDAIVEKSIPARFRSAGSDLAVDWTDYETWSRPRTKEDPSPANDPDASWGHARRNAPGATEVLFFGYYAQVATMVGDVGAEPIPELVRRIAFEAPSVDPARAMAQTLVRMSSTVALKCVICDCGYSNRDPAGFAVPLRRSGAQLVMDLHPADRGPKGSFEGAVIANGQLYCPATPPKLLELSSLRRGASKDETERQDEMGNELARYKLSAICSPDQDGYLRVRCPASGGKVRCARKPDSLALPGDRPTVAVTDDGVERRCCSQKTITVPPQIAAKTRQLHDYASREHRLSYQRRTAAERTYASLSDPSVGGMRRGWCRLFGLAKNTLVYALAVSVRNMRIADSFEKRQEAKPPSTARRKRPRRYQTQDGGRPGGRSKPSYWHPD